MRLRFPPASAALLMICCAACPDEVKTSAAPGTAVKMVEVTDRGFEPARIEVEAGKPVTLRFTRKTAQTCGEAVLIDGDPVEHRLPQNKSVDVQVTAPRSGELAFVCGMHMMRGVLVAR